MNRLLFLSALFLISACAGTQTTLKSRGDRDFKLFEKEKIRLEPAQNGKTNGKSVQRFSDGRMLLRTIRLPVYQKYTTVNMKISLSSAGDPWARPVSVFVIPKNSEVNLATIAGGESTFPTAEFPGVSGTKSYRPAVELFRFSAPFGIGFYNEKMENRRPVYIPKWENEVVYHQDVSRLISELKGEITIGIFIAGADEKGFEVSAGLSFDESNFAGHRAKKTVCIPVVNSNAYLPAQKSFMAFAEGKLEAEIIVPANLKNARLVYTAGAGGEDEFRFLTHKIRFDNRQKAEFTPQREDCAAYRRFNPQSGVWTEGRNSEGKYIQEFIASSDLSRAGWCPGSEVMSKEIPLGKLSAGKHTFSVEVPGAGKKGIWRISAYIIGEK